MRIHSKANLVYIKIKLLVYVHLMYTFVFAKNLLETKVCCV